MSSRTLYQLSGAALIIGSLPLIVGYTVNTYAFQNPSPGDYMGSLYALTYLLIVFGLLFVAAGLPAMYVCQAKQAGKLGLIGMSLTFFALLLLMGNSLTTGVLFSYVATVAPDLTHASFPPVLGIIFPITLLMFTSGPILLGIATMRARVLARGTGLLLILSGILNLVSLAPLADLVSESLQVATVILFALSLAWIGYALLSNRNGYMEAAPVASATASA